MHKFNVIGVTGIGAYTFGSVTYSKPDMVVKTTLDTGLVGQILYEAMLCLGDSVVDTELVLTGEDVDWVNGYRVLVRKVKGDDLFKHFAYNRDYDPNKEWLQLMLPDAKMRLPGEEGFVSNDTNPDTLIEDQLDLFYG